MIIRKEQIGNGVDGITQAELSKRISTKCPTGISRVDGKWVMDSDVPSSTKGTIAACDIDLDFEHIDMDEYDKDWTVTDYIEEEIACYEYGESDERSLGAYDEE